MTVKIRVNLNVLEIVECEIKIIVKKKKEKQTKPRKLNPSEFHNLLIKGNCPFGTIAPSRERLG